MQSIEDQVDKMGTYNSLDQMGMERYIQGIRKVVQNQLFPGNHRQYTKDDNVYLNLYNYQNQGINKGSRHNDYKNRLPSIDKVSRMAKAGGGADPLVGGRTNSSVNNNSESAF